MDSEWMDRAERALDLLRDMEANHEARLHLERAIKIVRPWVMTEEEQARDFKRGMH